MVEGKNKGDIVDSQCTAHPGRYPRGTITIRPVYLAITDRCKVAADETLERSLPLHNVARVNLVIGKVEIREVPVHFNDRGDYLWNEEWKTTGLNAKELDLISDKRSKRGG